MWFVWHFVYEANYFKKVALIYFVTDVYEKP